MRETITRLSALTDSEVESVAEVTALRARPPHAGQPPVAARPHREFAEEVLRERFLTLAGTVTYEDYDSFYRAKAMWHDELAAVTDQSYRKLRQVLFRMMVKPDC